MFIKVYNLIIVNIKFRLATIHSTEAKLPKVNTCTVTCFAFIIPAARLSYPFTHGLIEVDAVAFIVVAVANAWSAITSKSCKRQKTISKRPRDLDIPVDPNFTETGWILLDRYAASSIHITL